MRLAADGANVAINYHSSSAGADSAVAEITAAGAERLGTFAEIPHLAQP